MTLVIIIGIAIALFGLAYSTKRRFGVLGLGLSAGVLLAQNATNFIAKLLETNHIPVAPLTHDISATVALTLLPALLLLVAGPSYFSKRSAFIGATVFAVLGTLLILGPLTTALPTLDSGIKQTLDFIARWQGVIITVAIIAAVFDTILLHSSKPASRKHSQH